MGDMSLLPVFMIGMLGGTHCIGMCGGIVSAFSMAPGHKKIIPVFAVQGTGFSLALHSDAGRMLAYNGGRIASYVTAGAMAGGIAGSLRTLSSVSIVQMGGYWLANLMLLVLGLYLMGAWHGLTRLEAVGKGLWRRLQPMTRHLMPLDTPGRAFMLGALWGWVPCGMVYSVLLTAMVSGSAVSGGAVMLAFGLGTMPVLFTLGMLGARLQTWMRQRWVRVASGLVVIGFGLFGLLRLADGLSVDWFDTLCITPATGQHK